LTKNPVELNRHTGLGAMGIGLERHHRSDDADREKAIQPKPMCQFPTEFPDVEWLQCTI